MRTFEWRALHRWMVWLDAGSGGNRNQWMNRRHRMLAGGRRGRFGSYGRGRLGGRKNRFLGKRKVKLRRLLQLHQLSHPAVTASHVSKREVGGKSFGVEGFLWLGPGQRLLFLLCFHFSAIFRCKDLGALQVLVGVNVFGLFLLVLLSRLLLASGRGYILCISLSEPKNCTSNNKNSRAGNADEARRILLGRRGDGH